MPDSEKVSQGGPANFARLFYNYIAPNSEHQWIGIMFKNSNSKKISIKKRFIFLRREFHCLNLPSDHFGQITNAKSKIYPEKVLGKSIDRLTAFIKEKKVDIVFLNGFGVFNWMLLIAAKRAGVPTVIQHAGILTKELYIHRNSYSFFGIKIMVEMEKDSSRLASAEIFLNSWSMKYYNDNIHKNNKGKSLVIPLPFNFSTFKEYTDNESVHKFRSSVDKNKFNIGIIARWDDIKNHAAVLSLAREIRKQGLNWQIYSVVDIPDNPKYRSQKEEYQEYITIVPPLDRAGISDFCRSMNMMIQPSIFDVSPTVVLESMSLNTPIMISPNIGYVNNFMKYGAKDWVIDWENIPKVVERIKKLKNKSIPKALRNHLIKAHDQAKVFSAYLKVFSTLSAKSNKLK